MSDRPWMKWYPADWRADPALRMCSLASRGLWMEMLGFMYEAKPAGHLLVNGKMPTAPALAALVGSDPKIVSRALKELEENGVFSRTEDGTIFSRRMVRDHARSETGKEWIEKRWKNGHDPNSPPNRSPNSPPITKPNRAPNRGPTAYPITQKPEARKEERDNQPTHSQSRPREPLPGPANDRFAALAEKYALDEKTGKTHPIVNGYQLDVVFDLVCDAGRLNPATFRGDMRPLVQWLKDDFRSDQILAAVTAVASSPSYAGCSTLKYFDKAVRERRA